MDKLIEEIVSKIVEKKYPEESDIFSAFSNSLITKYKKPKKFLAASDKTEFGISDPLVSEILVAILVTISSEIIKDGYNVTKQKILEYLNNRKEKMQNIESKINIEHLTTELKEEIEYMIDKQ